MRYYLVVPRVVVAIALVSGSVVSAQSSCPDNRSPSGDVGIAAFICRASPCAVSLHDSLGYYHDFAIEPAIVTRQASRESGGLQRDDILVSVDGLPITTRAAGRRLANLKVGEAVALEVRRRGVRVPLHLIPQRGCNTPGLRVSIP